VPKNKKRRKPKPRVDARKKIALLDAFTEQDLETWGSRSDELQAYYDRVYFDLERQRSAHYDELCAALRLTPPAEVALDHWVRVTDWRWSLTPLSSAGSLKGIGGRFNIGCELHRARGQAFPCLYLACDIETSYREYFGAPPATRHGPLTLSEFALRRESSFTTFCLRGRLDHVFDLRKPAALAEFASIIGSFELSTDTQRLARTLGKAPRPLLRTPREIWSRVLAAPGSWRAEPQMFAIPAASQIFGRFVRDAGFEAVLYPSQQGGALCLAVFPQNFRASEAWIEVVGAMPDGAGYTLLNKTHLCLDDASLLLEGTI
jgi:hypothetical protein